jgi:hypothetical protein
LLGFLGRRNHCCKTMKRLLGNARNYLDGYAWRRSTGSRPFTMLAA